MHDSGYGVGAFGCQIKVFVGVPVKFYTKSVAKEVLNELRAVVTELIDRALTAVVVPGSHYILFQLFGGIVNAFIYDTALSVHCVAAESRFSFGQHCDFATFIRGGDRCDRAGQTGSYYQYIRLFHISPSLPCLINNIKLIKRYAQPKTNYELI